MWEIPYPKSKMLMKTENQLPEMPPEIEKQHKYSASEYIEEGEREIRSNTRAYQLNYVENIKERIKKQFKFYEESVNTILFGNEELEYYLRKSDGNIFNLKQNKLLKRSEIKNLFTIDNLYKYSYGFERIIGSEILDYCKKIFPVFYDPIKVHKELPLEKLKEIYSENDSNDLIIAPLGSGKTRNTIKALLEMNQKFIFVVPTKPLMYQIANDSDLKTPAIPEETEKQKAIDIISNNLGVVTYYDNFLKINSYLNRKWEYILVLDEYYTLVTHSSFRSAVTEVASEMYNYKKIIGLSGTAVGCYLEGRDFKVTNFEFSNLPESFINYHIVPHMLPDKDEEKRFINFIINYINTRDKRNHSGKTIIFYNDKEMLEKIRMAIKYYTTIQDNQIVIFSSEKKQVARKTPYQSLSDWENIKIILTTSIIANGISFLDKDYDSILIFNISDFIDVFQLLGRPRNNEKKIEVYDFIPGFSKAPIYNYDDMIYQEIQLSDNLIKTLNSMIELGVIKKHGILSLIKNKDFDTIYWTGEEVLTKSHFIYAKVIDQIGEASLDYPNIRERIFSEFGLTPNLIRIPVGRLNIDMNKIEELLKEEEKEMLDKFFRLLKTHKEEVIKFSQSEGILKRENVNKSEKNDELSSFTERNERLLDYSKFELWVKHYDFFSKNGMPLEYIKEYLEKFNHMGEQLTKNLMLISLVTRETENKKLLIDQHFAAHLDDYLKKNNNKQITIEELKAVISKYGKGSELAKYFYTNTIIKLKPIYKFRLNESKEAKKKKAGKKIGIYQIHYCHNDNKLDSLIDYFGLGNEFKNNRDTNHTPRARRGLTKSLEIFDQLYVQL